jgi:hypothetical protein
MSTFPPINNPVPYSKARSLLNTGDLVFLHGTSDAGVLIEKLEEIEGWPPYSHVGMVIDDSTVGGLYLWDAPGGGDCFKDPYAGDPDNRVQGEVVHCGCRVSPLDDVLAYYMSRVDTPPGQNGPGFWVRQLSPAVSPDRFGALRRFINRVDGLPFPSGPGSTPDEKAETGLGLNFAAGQKSGSVFYGSYFCSHLVADSYMHMGLLDMDVYPPNGYSPATFGMTNDPDRLRLVAPANLAAPFYVEWDRQVSKTGLPCPKT